MRTYTKRLLVRLKPEQETEIKRRCNNLEMPVSKYVRSRIFDSDEINWDEIKLKLKKLLVEERR